MSPRSRVPSLLFAAGFVAACSAAPMPGTTLGTYKVVANVTTNSCGLGAPDPWEFDVELSESGTTVYWNWMDGTPLMSGSLSGSQATLTAAVQADVDGDGGGPCTMNRDDSIGVTLGEGAAPPSFTGTIQYAFSAAAGATCTDQLTSQGGQYATLPCTIEYTTTGSRQ